MWYVIQTVTGKEENIKVLIETVVPEELYEDCIIIKYESKRKYEGRWHTESKKMFPGYLFIVTDHVDELYKNLRRIKEMTRILGTGDELTPLRPDEVRLLKRLMGKDDMVDMSYGFAEGDSVIIRDGALAGMEHLIRKIDRHKRKAYIEVELLGSTRLVEVGLEVLEKSGTKK